MRNQKYHSKGIVRSEVLELKARGLTNRQIAGRLGCTKSTVDYHLYPKRQKRQQKWAAEYRKTEKYRKYIRDYCRDYWRKRYHSDPKFREQFKQWVRRAKARHKARVRERMGAKLHVPDQ